MWHGCQLQLRDSVDWLVESVHRAMQRIDYTNIGFIETSRCVCLRRPRPSIPLLPHWHGHDTGCYEREEQHRDSHQGLEGTAIACNSRLYPIFLSTHRVVVGVTVTGTGRPLA